MCAHANLHVKIPNAIALFVLDGLHNLHDSIWSMGFQNALPITIYNLWNENKNAIYQSGCIGFQAIENIAMLQ